MSRFRLRTLMLAVAVLALILGLGLGLRRRGDRLRAQSIRYAWAAAVIETELLDPHPGQETDLLDRAHRYDAVGAAYREAAERPWILTDPDATAISCGCGRCAGLSGPLPPP